MITRQDGYKRVIAWISDLHVFGRYALNLPRFQTVEHIGIEIGEELMKIYNYWQYFISKCHEVKVDTVFAVGDLLHGQNPIERGTLLLSADMNEQQGAAVQLIEPLTGPVLDRGGVFYGIGGSGYHNSARGMSTEQSVIEKLGGKWLGKICNSTFDPSQKIFNIAHGESASFIYREMLLGREGTFLRESYAMDKIPKIKIFVRGHWHNYIHIDEKNMHMIQLPGWMAYEPSKPYLKSYGKMQGDIGAVITFLDSEDRLKVWDFILKEHPHICDAVQSL